VITTVVIDTSVITDATVIIDTTVITDATVVIGTTVITDAILVIEPLSSLSLPPLAKGKFGSLLERNE
jgi:hypothetical protein